MTRQVIKITISVFFIVGIVFYLNSGILQQSLIAWYLGLPQPQYQIIVESDLKVVSSDGTELATDVYRPDAPGKFPVIVARTLYDKASARHRYPLMAKIFSGQGYVFVMQDVRGKYGSGGDFVPYVYEAIDGHATVEWAGQAPWSDGNVAITGFSYLGSCAWLAATIPSPYLKTIVPLFSCQETYLGWFDRGVPYLKDMLFWISKYHPRTYHPTSHEEVDRVLEKFPVVQLDQLLNQKPLKTYQEYLHHPAPGEFWNRLSSHQSLEAMDIPILIYGGWYDRFSHISFEDFSRLRARNIAPTQVIIGPWVHNPMDIHGDLPFPDNGHFTDQFKVMLKWFDIWLKGEGKQAFQYAPIQYYVMGKNEWREAYQWPPKGYKEEKFFLANNSLSPQANVSSESLQYLYDPENPTPSIGTSMIYANGWEGALEQSVLVKREDVVTFVSEPLEKELTVAGPSKLVLYVSSSAVDTDFCAKLADQHPDGKSYYIQTGYLRMCYRDSIESPTLMTPGEIYRIEIPIPSTAYTFQKEHHIQLQISSSDFPYHSRNLNREERPEEGTVPLVAEQSIFMGGEHDSQLVLPVIQ